MRMYYTNNFVNLNFLCGLLIIFIALNESRKSMDKYLLIEQIHASQTR